MLVALVVVPLLLAVAAFVVNGERRRPWLVPLGGVLHLGLVLAALSRPPEPTAGRWLVLDPLGRVVLSLTSVVFLLCALYAPGYLADRTDRRNRVFCASLLVFLSMMTLISLSHHLGLMWVAIEATTLAAAPLIYFNRNPRSLEATWKYLLVGSVGIAIALLGSFFLAYSALHAGMAESLLFDDLVLHARQLSPPWLRSAFLLLFVGYGTKMGLAPMHTWKPDAYGEAPGLVGTLLAAGVTSAAFLAILRFYQICHAAGEAAFARPILLVFGLLSMAVGAVFMARQRDYKRMLAYSSVEHMGILVLGIGIGGLATFGALLHLINNALAKGVLFLAAGNIHRAYGSKLTGEVSGALRRLPLSGGLFFAGFFAVTGSPPFGPFLSEFTILNGAVASGQYLAAGIFLLLLFVVFVGMGATVLAVVQGEPPGVGETPAGGPTVATPAGGERFLTVAPIFAFLALVVLLGLYIPPPVARLLGEAAAFLEGRS